MLTFETTRGVDSCEGWTRRDFLRAGTLGAGALGLSLADLEAARGAGDSFGDERSCIVLFLVGGPSQLDTWDLKPHAPDRVRGPFRPIATTVPGFQVAETFPHLARQAGRVALVRSLHHTEAPIHETGHQLLQTGRLSVRGIEAPSYGAVLSQLRGGRGSGIPASMLLPGPMGNTGVSVSHGQGAGFLGERHEPITVADVQLSCASEVLAGVDAVHRASDRTTPRDEAGAEARRRLFAPAVKQALDLSREPERIRNAYGATTFGQSCLMARRLVEAGVRLVTVNMFDTVFNALSWDCHADEATLPTTLEDYRNILCPLFDRAYSALLDDLAERGQLERTLVVAMGEFGRTPEINPRGGRDHWPGCWSMLFAGGGVRGGQVIGASDATASEPKDRPVTPAEVVASVYHALGVDPTGQIPGPDGTGMPIVEASPISELFGS